MSRIKDARIRREKVTDKDGKTVLDEWSCFYSEADYALDGALQLLVMLEPDFAADSFFSAKYALPQRGVLDCVGFASRQGKTSHTLLLSEQVPGIGLVLRKRNNENAQELLKIESVTGSSMPEGFDKLSSFRGLYRTLLQKRAAGEWALIENQTTGLQTLWVTGARDGDLLRYTIHTTAGKSREYEVHTGQLWNRPLDGRPVPLFRTSRLRKVKADQETDALFGRVRVLGMESTFTIVDGDTVQDSVEQYLYALPLTTSLPFPIFSRSLGRSLSRSGGVVTVEWGSELSDALKAQYGVE